MKSQGGGQLKQKFKKKGDFFNKNPRMRMLVNTYDRMNSEKKINMINTASNYLNSL